MGLAPWNKELFDSAQPTIKDISADHFKGKGEGSARFCGIASGVAFF